MPSRATSWRSARPCGVPKSTRPAWASRTRCASAATCSGVPENADRSSISSGISAPTGSRAPGEMHGRRPALAEFPVRLAVRTDDDDARRAVIHQDAQGRPLLHRVAARDRKHELIAAPGEFTLHDFGDRLEARVHQVGHDQPDERRSCRAQGTRADVRPVSELGRDGADLGYGFLAHPARTAQRTPGRADRHPAAWATCRRSTANVYRSPVRWFRLRASWERSRKRLLVHTLATRSAIVNSFP